MALTFDQLAAIRAWTTDDLTLAVRTYQRAHPDAAGGPVLDTPLGSLTELRLVDILSQRLAAQLAQTFLIPPAQQDLADRLDALYSNVSVSSWTSVTPPAVAPANFYHGDLFEALGTDPPPSVIATMSLPNGVDIEQGGLGSLSHNAVIAHVFYVLPYQASRQRQQEARRGAEAVAAILQTYRQDPVTNWTNGQVKSVQTNTPRLPSGDIRFITGYVAFSCEAFTGYTPTRS